MAVKKKKGAGKKKAVAKKKTAVKKKAAPKKPQLPEKVAAKKKAAPKKAAKRNTPPTKPSAAPTPMKPAPVAVAKPAAKPVPKPAPKPVQPPLIPRDKPPLLPSSGSVTAAEVNLGHVVALRPRTHTGFRPEAFAQAKRALADARYATIEEAARAVAEKATELSNESGPTPFSAH